MNAGEKEKRLQQLKQKMFPKDTLVKYLGDEQNIRVIATNASVTVDDARIRHRLFPGPAIALGRLLVGGLLMASTLKEEAVISLRVNGSGPLNYLAVDATYEGYVRGYCSEPQLDEDAYEPGRVAPLIGDGTLTVRKMIDQDSKGYDGIVNLYTGEIGTDIAYYYLQSEQIPTAISVGVYYDKKGFVSAAGGILVQALPPQQESFLEKLETVFSRSPVITDLILDGSDADGIVQAYLPGFELDRIEDKSPMFKCPCSRPRTEQALISLGKEELASLKEEEEPIDVTCDYCGQHYYFKYEDIDQLILESTRSE